MIAQRSSLYQAWSSEDLVRAASVEREEYRPEAMDLIEAELRRREVISEEREHVEQRVALDRDLSIQKLTGVRGWLLIFVLIVIWNSIAAIFGGLGQFLRYPAAGIVLLPAWAAGAYGCYVVALLIQKKRTAPKHASRWLIAVFVMTLFYAGLTYLMTREVSLVPFYGLATLIWLEYLQKSRRVAATYGRSSENVEPLVAADGATRHR